MDAIEQLLARLRTDSGYPAVAERIWCLNERLLGAAPPKAGEKVLDIGAAIGDTAISLADVASSSAEERAHR